MQFNHYLLYGLRLRTLNAIPYLQSINETQKVDLQITFEARKTGKTYPFQTMSSEIYTSYGLASNNIPYLTVWKQHNNLTDFLVIRYTNGKETVFYVSDRNGKNLNVLYHPNIPINDIYTYLLGPVIGCILRLKNQVCLHASVVNINQQAIAFIGEKTAGKSTLIANFAVMGYPILSDDIAVLVRNKNITKVHTGYPRLRLWRKSLEQHDSIDIKQLTPVLANIDKYYLPLDEQNKTSWKFQSTQLPFGAIIYLNHRNEKGILSLNQLNLMASFLKMKQNIYAEYMLDDELLKKEFATFGQISQQIPTLTLERPNNLQELNNTCQLIINWVLQNLK